MQTNTHSRRYLLCTHRSLALSFADCKSLPRWIPNQCPSSCLPVHNSWRRGGVCRSQRAAVWRHTQAHVHHRATPTVERNHPLCQGSWFRYSQCIAQKIQRFVGFWVCGCCFYCGSVLMSRKFIMWNFTSLNINKMMFGDSRVHGLSWRLLSLHPQLFPWRSTFLWIKARGGGGGGGGGGVLLMLFLFSHDQLNILARILPSSLMAEFYYDYAHAEYLL